MSRHLTVNATLELLTELKSAVSDLAAKERKLVQEHHSKTGAQLRRFDAATEEESARLAAALAQAESSLQTRQQAARARHERRRARLAAARKASRKQALDRIEREEGRHRYAVQKGLLDTERNRMAERAANDQRLADFQARLAERHAAFIDLEQQAQRAFRGYRQLARQLTHPPAQPEPDATRSEEQLLAELNELFDRTSAELKRFRRFFIAAFFRVVSLWWLTALLVLAAGAAVPILRYFDYSNLTYVHAVGALVVGLVLLVLLYQAGQRKARALATSIAGALERARRWHAAGAERALAHHQQEIERIETEAQNWTNTLNQQWADAAAEAESRRQAWPKRVEEKAVRATATNDRALRETLDRLSRHQVENVERLKQESETRRRPVAQEHERRLAQFEAEYQARWQALEAEWTSRLRPIYQTMTAAHIAATDEFPEWRPELWVKWEPPTVFDNAARFGHLEVDLGEFCEALPQDPRLTLPGPARLSVPLVLTYPQQGSVLLETSAVGGEAVADTLNNIILRLLSKARPGKVTFTIIDPVKLGQNFAGVMHLADYEENLINSRIWTQTTEIEQRLADLNEHMEKVIQMYLRNEYATIAEYNDQAGNIAEKYHFLVIADFPVNFSETAMRRLVNIAASGARCGVYTLIHWDRRQVAPPDFVTEELRKNSISIACAQVCSLVGHSARGLKLVLDKPPPPELATELLHKVGVSGKNANRVEVPFAHVAPAEAEVWTRDTTEEVTVPIGRTGATKLQHLSIGRGTRQHALIAGKTGSGKSTLFHVIITNLAMWSSPEQVEFYLVDFKKGVEFKCYASQRLPHARVVAIESDREFGLSVLQRVDEELKRRGDLFRQLGVQDVAGYKRAGGTESIPRSLLIIDEFQEFFVEDDRIAQGAAVLLDRIVRQGRAFGLHVLLGSQTLGGAYTLARTTMGQMVIRIALQCNEADAYLIMDENNPAPRLLSRPGEGIYNDMAGLIEGNSPFQTVWLSDEEREGYLAQVRARAEATGKFYPAPFVFEGNAPADVRENNPLRALLAQPPAAAPAAPRIWLGAPNSIKGPTEAVFHRQSGNHLLIVGQREEAALAIVGLGLLSLAAQYPRETARLIVFDSTPPGSPQRDFLQRVTQAIPRGVTLAHGSDLTAVLEELAREVKKRADEEHATPAPANFLFIYGLQNFRKMRQEDEFAFSSGDADAVKPAALLNELVVGGAAHGVHVIATCDTYNNVTRFLGRKGLTEFEMRVLFQMSANDSASLIDNPKASTLGLHRALFYNEHEGYLETFRPYALPASEWLTSAAAQLAPR